MLLKIVPKKLKRFEVELLTLTIKEYLQNNKSKTPDEKEKLELLLEQLEIYLDLSNAEEFELF